MVNQSETYFIYMNDTLVGRTGTFINADNKAKQTFEQYPTAVVTIQRQRLIEDEVRSYKPYNKPETRRIRNDA